MLTERDIVYEVGDFWVRRVDAGHFEVYRSGATHSARVATIHYSNDEARALSRATADANRRASFTHR